MRIHKIVNSDKVKASMKLLPKIIFANAGKKDKGEKTATSSIEQQSANFISAEPWLKQIIEQGQGQEQAA